MCGSLVIITLAMFPAQLLHMTGVIRPWYSQLMALHRPTFLIPIY